MTEEEKVKLLEKIAVLLDNFYYYYQRQIEKLFYEEEEIDEYMLKDLFVNCFDGQIIHGLNEKESDYIYEQGKKFKETL